MELCTSGSPGGVEPLHDPEARPRSRYRGTVPQRGSDCQVHGRVLMKNHGSRISERCIMYRYIGELVPKSSQPGGSSGRAVYRACPGRMKGKVISSREGLAEQVGSHLRIMRDYVKRASGGDT